LKENSKKIIGPDELLAFEIQQNKGGIQPKKRIN
jgi:hypothetical protein